MYTRLLTKRAARGVALCRVVLRAASALAVRLSDVRHVNECAAARQSIEQHCVAPPRCIPPKLRPNTTSAKATSHESCPTAPKPAAGAAPTHPRLQRRGSYGWCGTTIYPPTESSEQQTSDEWEQNHIGPLIDVEARNTPSLRRLCLPSLAAYARSCKGRRVRTDRLPTRTTRCPSSHRIVPRGPTREVKTMCPEGCYKHHTNG